MHVKLVKGVGYDSDDAYPDALASSDGDFDRCVALACPTELYRLRRGQIGARMTISWSGSAEGELSVLLGLRIVRSLELLLII